MDSVQSVDIKRTEMKAEPSTPQNNGGVRVHEFVSKTVCLMSIYPKLIIFLERITVFVFLTTLAF